MRCALCQRPLKRFAATAKTRAGLIGWGPKCSIAAGQAKQSAKPRRKRDTRTVDWVEAIA